MLHAVTFVVMAAAMITAVLAVNGLSFSSFLVYLSTLSQNPRQAEESSIQFKTTAAVKQTDLQVVT